MKAIGESLPLDPAAIRQALSIQAPLECVELPVAELKDQLAILDRQGLELREQKRLQLFRTDAGFKRLETEAERREQAAQLSLVEERTARVRQALKQARALGKLERERLQAAVRAQLDAIESHVLADLVETRDLVQRTLASGMLPADPETRDRVLDLVAKRQLRGLKDIANHALVVEQSAIAPLTMGIIHYKRRREIQEAMTTFVHDEAKHSVSIVGLPEDPFEAEIAKRKFETVVDRVSRSLPDLLEARSVIKTSERAGQRHRYEVEVELITPRKTTSFGASGWSLPEIFDELSNKMKRVTTKKRERPRRRLD